MNALGIIYIEGLTLARQKGLRKRPNGKFLIPTSIFKNFYLSLKSYFLMIFFAQTHYSEKKKEISARHFDDFSARCHRQNPKIFI